MSPSPPIRQPLRHGLLSIIFAVVTTATASADDAFVDRASTLGIDFTHFNGMSGALYLPEIMGSGAALFDFDRDGDLDLFVVQGAELAPDGEHPAPLFPPAKGTPVGHRLFRNQLADSGRLAFTDISADSGIDTVDYGMGVAVGDIDNDGLPDLYVTTLGRNRLFHNLGNGRFEDIAATAGVDDPAWAVSAAFIDYDGDGWQDLYVGNYLEIDLAHYRDCRSPSSALDYCGPKLFPPVSDRLYRNLGNGRFEDVSRRSGIGRPQTPTLGVSVADFNGDQRPDLYIANDAKPNLLWLNQGDGHFIEDAMMAGAAVNIAGAAEGSMGVDAADVDGDGDPDLFMTHLNGETHTLYINDGQGWFEDRTQHFGLGASSKPYTGFGANWLDIDNDGWLDLFIANGEVNRVRALSDQGDPYPLHQPNQLLLNTGGQGFRDVSAKAGAVFALSEVSRGSSVGDIDNDGDSDILVSNNAGPLRLLLNQWPAAGHWLGLRLLNQHGGDALGARVEVSTDHDHGRPHWRQSRAGGSYASASDPRVLIGLDAHDTPVDVRVHWPDGSVESWPTQPIDRYHTLTQGQGEPGTDAAK